MKMCGVFQTWEEWSKWKKAIPLEGALWTKAERCDTAGLSGKLCMAEVQGSKKAAEKVKSREGSVEALKRGNGKPRDNVYIAEG